MHPADPGSQSQPVATPGRRDRAWLRREVVKQVRPLWALAAVSALVPLALIALMVVVRPAEVVNSVGLADEQTVTVLSASVDDRSGKSRDRERYGPRWTVSVSWMVDGIRHTATDTFRSNESFAVGQVTTAVSVGDRISLRPGRPGLVLLGIAALLGVGGLGAALYLGRARLWFTVLGVAPDGPRVRARVADPPVRHEEQPTRFRPAELGHLVAMARVDQVPGDGKPALRRLFVLRARHRWVLQAGDEVDVWSAGRVSAIRRVADGYWWLTAVDSAVLGPVLGR